jgi:O-antigen/teichoic acid export membrane protein
MAFSVSVLSAGLRDGGASRILIKDGSDDPATIRSIAAFCLIFNLLATVVMLALIPLAVRYFQEPRIIPLMLLLALATALATPTTVGCARLSIEMRFDSLAKLNTAVGAIRVILILVLALAGAGAMSLVIPLPILAVVRWIALKRMVGPMPDGPNFSTQTFWKIFVAGRWVMLAALAVSVASHGDYLILGRWGKDKLGDYFFAFQIVILVYTIFTQTILSVMMPVFTKIHDQTGRFALAFRRVSKLTILLGAIAGAGMMLVAPAVIHFIWQGKWDDAIAVVQVLSIYLCVGVLSPLYIAVLQSKGHWSTYAISFIVEAAIVLVATSVAVWMNLGLAGIALVVALFRSITPPIYTLHCGKLLGVSSSKLICDLGTRMLLPMAAGVLIILVSVSLNLHPHSLQDFGLRIILFSVTAGLLAKFVFRDDFLEAWSLVGKRSPRIS